MPLPIRSGRHKAHTYTLSVCIRVYLLDTLKMKSFSTRKSEIFNIGLSKEQNNRNDRDTQLDHYDDRLVDYF